MGFLTTPVIPFAVLLAWGGSARAFLPFTVPLLIALLVYALLVRFPQGSE